MRGVFRNILFLTLAGSLLVVLLEFGLRVVFYKKTAQEKSKIENLAFCFDKDYQVSVKPNIDKLFVRSRNNGGDSISWHTNQDAFRGASLRKNPGSRVIVYGDSNILARFSRLEDTYVIRLQNYLNEHYGTDDIEVLNAGVVGLGPDQNLIRFCKEADVYQPDLVIFHIYADNDFGDMIRNRLYDLDPQGKLVRTPFEPAIDAFFTRESLMIVKAARRLTRLLAPKEMKVLRGQDYIDVIVSVSEKEYAVYKESKPKKFSNFVDHYDFDIATNPNSESSRVKVNLMKAVLKKAKDKAVEKGIEFVVLIEPSAIDFKKDVVPNREHLERFEAYKPTNLSGVIEEICREHDIENINLFEVFDRNRDQELYFIGIDNHWNDRGQDVAARETASYIARKNILERNRSDKMTGDPSSSTE